MSILGWISVSLWEYLPFRRDIWEGPGIPKNVSQVVGFETNGRTK